jgi:hypothetical protein
MASGGAVHRIHGRYFPQRDSVRSDIAPMIGSLNASTMRELNKIIPAVAAEIPKTSV